MQQTAKEWRIWGTCRNLEIIYNAKFIIMWYLNNSHILINYEIDSFRTNVFIWMFSESGSSGKIQILNPNVVHEYL
jgi:hypothetical protein